MGTRRDCRTRCHRLDTRDSCATREFDPIYREFHRRYCQIRLGKK